MKFFWLKDNRLQRIFLPNEKQGFIRYQTNISFINGKQSQTDMQKGLQPWVLSLAMNEHHTSLCPFTRESKFFASFQNAETQLHPSFFLFWREPVPTETVAPKRREPPLIFLCFNIFLLNPPFGFHLSLWIPRFQPLLFTSFLPSLLQTNGQPLKKANPISPFKTDFPPLFFLFCPL